MKNNLISAIAGWKSAALLALVAMVAAVALGGVLSTTQTAEAQISVTPEDDPVVAVPPGTTVVVAYPSAEGDRYRFSPDSEGTATFVANGSTNIRCGDYVSTDTSTLRHAACDVNPAAGTSLLVKVDGDSPLGSIYVQKYARPAGGITPSTTFTEAEIRVSPANPPVAFKALYVPGAAIPADGTTNVTLTVQLVDANARGLHPQSVLVTTTRGVLTSTTVPSDSTDTPIPCGPSVSSCILETQAAAGANTPTDPTDDVTAGTVTVTLTGNGSTGTAEVSFHHQASGLSHTASVIIHGNPASISAEVDQSTIAIGGSTFIVVTILDADGNPTVGKFADVNNTNPLVPAIRGPEVPAGSSAIAVTKDINVDRNLPGVLNDIPACGDHPVDDPGTAEVDESLGALGTPPGSTPSGTNTAGKCVIQVTAPNPAGTANDATRGTHTLTVAATATAAGAVTATIPTVDVEIQVGGVPAALEHDAPANVDSLSTTPITVTVLDDEGVRVGAVPIEVIQIEGSGNADPFPGATSEAKANTSDGRATFTYLAPLSSGEAVFLIRAGHPGATIQDTVTIAIGAAAEEDPEAPAATWNNELVSGQNVVVWNGDDGADASAGSADGVTAIWSYNTGSGSWDGYFPEAADVPGGNTLTSLSSNQAYVVIVN
ncbi:MAG: hypothetical protein OXE43_03345 [Chloroflexi bacterium]|nr:hypothetical protein [Chloroflexota bacterium]